MEFRLGQQLPCSSYFITAQATKAKLKEGDNAEELLPEEMLLLEDELEGYDKLMEVHPIEETQR